MEPKGVKPPEGMGVPSMMRQMMEKMRCRGEFNPSATCQGMMGSEEKADETPAYPTPQIRELFEEWARNVGDEMLAVLRARGPLDLATLARALKISPQGALHLLGKLVDDGKATISSIQAAGG